LLSVLTTEPRDGNYDARKHTHKISKTSAPEAGEIAAFRAGRRTDYGDEESVEP
jgi:hypothetical protein